MIRKNTFVVSTTTTLSATTDYVLDGSAAEGISWRNVFGQCLSDVDVVTIDDSSEDLQPVTLLESGFNIPAAGVYDVKVLSVGLISGMGATNYATLEVSSGSPFNKLTPAVNGEDVIVDVDTDVWHPQIIPGLKVKIRPYGTSGGITEGDRFQIIIGGRWLSEENRYLEDLLFGGVSANDDTGTDAVKLTIQNVSGVDLKNVQAVVVNKISIDQPQYQLDKTTTELAVTHLSPYWTGYSLGSYRNVELLPHPLDLVTPLIGPNWRGAWSNLGYYYFNDGVEHDGKYYLFGSIESNVLPPGIHEPGESSGWMWLEVDEQLTHDPIGPKAISQTASWYGTLRPKYPFARNILTHSVLSEYLHNFWTGFGFWADYDTVSGVPRYPWYNYLRYDFGPGVAHVINVIGLSGALWNDLTILGSQDDTENPENWEYIGMTDNCGSAVYDSSGGYISYTAYKNTREYRHIAFRQDVAGSDSGSPPSRRQPILQVVELIYYPPDKLNVDRNRPFELIDQSSLMNPPYEVGGYPKTIEFENFGGGYVDVVVDRNAWDVSELYLGEALGS